MPAGLDPGRLPVAEQRIATPRHLLALTGGGFRGLFTARVLEQMETAAGANIAGRFDLIAGTSIGGIVAIGLACGISATHLVALIREHGPAIFRPKRGSLAGFAAARYDSRTLRSAIEHILGAEVSRTPFADLPAALLVVAVNERMSVPKIFKTRLCAPGETDEISTLDVAMATSAAPTYFAPHAVGDDTFVDGGIIANAPDLIVIGEAMRRFGADLDNLHLCSVGTAGSARVGQASGRPGKLGWMVRHELIELIMDAQAALAAEQVSRVRPGSVLRIDKRPARRIGLDDVAERTAIELIGLADQAVEEARTGQTASWRRFLAHQPLAS